MRKVFLDGLPKRKYGKSLVNDWANSVGYKVKFIYDDIAGEIEIVDYYIYGKNPYIKIKYNNSEAFDIFTNHFVNCKLAIFFERITSKYKFNIGDIVDKIEILDQIKYNDGKAYKYKCLNCGNIDIISEYSLIDNSSCNVCCVPSRKILKGYNDLWTTHPDIAKLLKYPEYGYEISYGSNNKEIFICKNCNFEKNIKVADIINRGFACPQCSDGKSYPEKFVFNLLSQLNFIFDYDQKFRWSQNKRYDFYLSKFNLIIEVHGMQHYKIGLENISQNIRTLDEEQENDKFKEELALKNRIKHYIVIDARYSEIEFIKNNIINSELAKLFNLTNIDWLKCHEYACNSLVKKACELWNNGICSTIKIEAIMKVRYTTICHYLKMGAKLGWCNYDTTIIRSELGKNIGGHNKEKIIQLDMNYNFIKEWLSINQAADNLKIKSSCIVRCCKNIKWCKSAGGYKWMYKTDWEQLTEVKLQELKNSVIKDLKLICINDNNVFNNFEEAGKYYNINKNYIARVCNHQKYKSTKGYKFMYYEDYIKQNEKVS